MQPTTLEKKAQVKNGMSRMIVACLAILIQLILLISLFTQLAEYTIWVNVLLEVLAIVLVLKIYGKHTTASMKMPWIIMAIVSPLLGVLLYFLVGSDGYSRGMRKRYQQIDEALLPLLPDGKEAARQLAGKDFGTYGVSNYISRNAHYPVYHHSKVTYYDSAVKGLEAQLQEMAKAEHFIFMEYHAIENAEAWQRIQTVLEERAAAGVEVRVFYDDMGSIGFIDTDFKRQLESKGIACRVFNPFIPVFNVFLNNRDHRKITVIDGRVGFTGGYNLANEYFGITHPFGEWKDTGIMIEGDAVQSLTVTFLEMWNAVPRQGDPDTSVKKYLPDSGDDRDMSVDFSESPEGFGRRAADALAATVKEGTPLASAAEDRGTAAAPTAGKAGEDPASAAEDGEMAAAPAAEKAAKEPCPAVMGAGEKPRPAEGDAKEPCGGPDPGFVQPYADSPMDEERVGENVYITMIGRAERYCWFMTPYLIITDEMTHALTLAAKRGVDVRIITPGIPDKKMVYSVTRSFYNSLVRDGVRVYEWTPGFNHAKMCLVDGQMATCGTINLDYRSLYHHFENGCFFCGCEAVRDMEADFTETFAQCRDVTEQYRTGRSASLRLWQLFLRLFAWLM